MGFPLAFLHNRMTIQGKKNPAESGALYNSLKVMV
jgi:hypothetical protein